MFPRPPGGGTREEKDAFVPRPKGGEQERKENAYVFPPVGRENKEIKPLRERRVTL